MSQNRGSWFGHFQFLEELLQELTLRCSEMPQHFCDIHQLDLGLLAKQQP